MNAATASSRCTACAGQVGELALANGVLLYHLAPARVSLEEAFMELTADSTEFEGKN